MASLLTLSESSIVRSRSLPSVQLPQMSQYAEPVLVSANFRIVSCCPLIGTLEPLHGTRQLESRVVACCRSATLQHWSLRYLTGVLTCEQANHRRLISLGEEPSLLDATGPAADPFAGPAAAAPLVLERPGRGSSHPFANGGSSAGGGHGGRGGPPMPTWGGAQHMFSGHSGGVQVPPVAVGGGENNGGLPRVAPAPSGAFSASLDSLAQRLGISAPPPAVPGPMPAALRAPLPPVAEAAVSSATRFVPL